MHMTRTAFLLTTLLSLPIAAFANKTDSVYTSLKEQDCSVLERDPDGGDFVTERCQGVSGYGLHLLSGDLRQTLDVITPTGAMFQLDLISKVSGGFSTLGETAEWRVTKVGKTTTPTALIVRFNASEDPENTEKLTSYLVVSKITADSICVTDIVKPMKNANERARQLADQAASKTCQ